jgi:hypothetical protein
MFTSLLVIDVDGARYRVQRGLVQHHVNAPGRHDAGLPVADVAFDERKAGLLSNSATFFVKPLEKLMSTHPLAPYLSRYSTRPERRGSCRNSPVTRKARLSSGWSREYYMM